MPSKITSVVSARVPNALAAELRQAAAASGVTMSELLRRVLEVDLGGTLDLVQKGEQ